MDIVADYKLGNGDYRADKTGISEPLFVGEVEDHIGGACCVGVFGNRKLETVLASPIASPEGQESGRSVYRPNPGIREGRALKRYLAKETEIF